MITLLLIIADNLIRQRERRIRKEKYERLDKDRQLKTKPTPKPSTKKYNEWKGVTYQIVNQKDKDKEFK